LSYNIFIDERKQMKKLLLMVILSVFAITSQSQTIGLEKDKILHFAASYTISYQSYKYLEPRYGKQKAKLYSTILSLSIGIAKEIIDERYRKGWEPGDMVANGGGIIIFRLSL